MCVYLLVFACVCLCLCLYVYMLMFKHMLNTLQHTATRLTHCNCMCINLYLNVSYLGCVLVEMHACVWVVCVCVYTYTYIYMYDICMHFRVPPCRCHPIRAVSVLQCVAVRCSVLQCVAVWCSALQCVAVCCSVLHKRLSNLGCPLAISSL